jgi:glucokinase
MPATLVLDIGGSSVKVAIVDGQIRGRPVPIALQTASVDELARVVVETIGAVPDVDRVAISTAGVLDADGVVVLSGAIEGYVGTAWAQTIEAAFPGRFAVIAVANDGRCAAWGEFLGGQGQAVSSLSHFVVGTGVGGGAVVDGVLLQDPHGYASNFGHVAVPSEDPAGCGCGQSHCVEAFAATRGVLRDVDATTIPALSARLRAGDPAAAEAFAAAGAWLGYAIADVAETVGTETFTLGGGLVVAARTDAGNVYVDAAASSARELSARPLRVLESDLGNDAALIGAAALASGDLDRDRRHALPHAE